MAKEKNSNVHWTTLAGFWLGVISVIVAVVFGVLELRKKDRNPRKNPGKGKAQNEEVVGPETGTPSNDDAP